MAIKINKLYFASRPAEPLNDAVDPTNQQGVGGWVQAEVTSGRDWQDLQAAQLGLKTLEAVAGVEDGRIEFYIGANKVAVQTNTVFGKFSFSFAGIDGGGDNT